jgi:5-methylcytosine-specific restriction endonuclease McrA
MTDKEWQIEVLRAHKLCEICGQLATVAHHFISKGASSKLRHEISNGIGLCHNCHNLIHTKAGYNASIIKKRGEEWIKNLNIKKRV